MKTMADTGLIKIRLGFVTFVHNVSWYVNATHGDLSPKENSTMSLVSYLQWFLDRSGKRETNIYIFGLKYGITVRNAMKCVET